MAYGTVNADVIGTSVANSNIGAGNATRFKNRIINGDMRIDQRNAGASVTPANTNYTLDRWKCYLTQSSKFTIQQNASSATLPAGFTNYLGVTSSSAYSVGSSDYFVVSQSIEGLNIADLGWGTANAKTVTLSFWVRSSLTGTFGGSFGNNAGDRSYPFSYTISSANTWTQISITIAGDTSGTWLTNNSGGIWLYFGLGVGSTFSGTANTWAAANYVSATSATSVVGTNAATWYITGIQLEVGSSATGFEYVDYGTQLEMCQRYFYRVYDQQNTGGGVATSSTVNSRYSFPITMRSSPTVSVTTSGSWVVGNDYSANYTAGTVGITGYAYSPQGGRITINGFSGLPGSGTFLAGSDATGTGAIGLSAEL